MQLHPTVFRTTIQCGVVGNGVGLTVTLSTQSICGDSLFNQVVHHRCRTLFRKLLVTIFVSNIVCITGDLKLDILELYQNHGNTVQILFGVICQVYGAQGKGYICQNDVRILLAAKLVNRDSYSRIRAKVKSINQAVPITVLFTTAGINGCSSYRISTLVIGI